MFVTAVVCPPAPLLVPGLADRLAAQAPEFCSACEQAVRRLDGVDEVTVLATGPGRCVAGPGDVVTAGLARSDRPVLPPVRLPGTRSDSAPRPVAVATDVAAAMLQRCGITAPAHAVEVSGKTENPARPDTPSGRRPSWVTPGDPAGRAIRTGLLVMGDGAACHGEHAPGAPDPRAEAFDADLVTALRSGDPATLAAACSRLHSLAGPLRAESLPALAALAAVTATLGAARAEVLHYSAPFGVGYPVAVWQWDPPR